MDSEKSVTLHGGSHLCRKCGRTDSLEELWFPLVHHELLRNTPGKLGHIVHFNPSHKKKKGTLDGFTCDRYLGTSSAIRLSVAALTSEGLMMTQFPTSTHQRGQML